MKKTALIAFCLVAISIPGCASRLLVGVTGLAAFQPSYFEGVAPGICTTTEIDNLLLRNDLVNVHADLYYIGIGFLSDSTLELGYRIPIGSISAAPALGFGINFGPNNKYIYLPASLIVDLFDNKSLSLQVWAQIRGYMDLDKELNRWLGWKAAVDLVIKWSSLGLYFEPIAGGGGTETLIGLRIGMALYF